MARQKRNRKSAGLAVVEGTKYHCHDCGSTIPFHHTPLCDMAEPNARRDLPQIPRTQWWDKNKKHQPKATAADIQAAAEAQAQLEEIL